MAAAAESATAATGFPCMEYFAFRAERLSKQTDFLHLTLGHMPLAHLLHSQGVTIFQQWTTNG